jgi:Cyclic nucleotide-binding domain
LCGPFSCSVGQDSHLQNVCRRSRTSARDEGPGTSFAELPVFDGGNYPASASAVEDAEVLFISRKDFQNFCREHPDVALKVIAVVGSRLRRLVGIIEDLSFTTVRHRLIGLILRLTQTSGTASKEDVCGINEESSRPSCGIRNCTRTCLTEFEPTPSRRFCGSRWSQDHRERSRRSKARASVVRVIPPSEDLWAVVTLVTAGTVSALQNSDYRGGAHEFYR